MNANGSKARRRRGYALVEIAMAVFVLLAAMGVAVRLVYWVASERRQADRRLWAVEEAANLLERIAAEPYEAVDSARARALAEAADAPRVLPDAEWTIQVVDQPAGTGPAGKRIAVSLRWKARSGQWDAPVRLSGWVYRGRNRS